MLKKLEDIVKAVLCTPGTLPESGEQFVRYLLQHPSHDFRRLGIFSLYCIAIGLQDKANQQNVNVFNEDDVLRTLT